MTGRRLVAPLVIGLALSAGACSGLDVGPISRPGATSPDPVGSDASAGSSTDAPSIAPTAGDSGSSPGSEAPDFGGELVIWADDARASVLKPLADGFAAHRGVTVTVEAVSENMVPNFLTASQAGVAPDIVAASHDAIGQLVANDAIRPVDIPAGVDLDPLAIAGMTYEGKLYGIPDSVENVALYLATGLVTTCPATMEDLIATGGKLRDEGETSEIMALPVGPAGQARAIYPLFASGGGTFFGRTATGDLDPGRVTLDSAASIDAGKRLRSIGEKGAKALKTAIDDATARSLFLDGKAAFLVAGSDARVAIEKAAIPFDICPIPRWREGGPADPLVDVAGYFLSTKGQNTTLADAFAREVLLAPETQLASYRALGRRPATLTAIADAGATDPTVAKFRAAAEGGVVVPPIPQMALVWGPFGIAEAALVRGADVRASLEAAAATIRDGIALQ